MSTRWSDLDHRSYLRSAHGCHVVFCDCSLPSPSSLWKTFCRRPSRGLNLIARTLIALLVLRPNHVFVVFRGTVMEPRLSGGVRTDISHWLIHNPNVRIREVYRVPCSVWTRGVLPSGVPCGSWAGTHRLRDYFVSFLSAGTLGWTCTHGACELLRWFMGHEYGPADMTFVRSLRRWVRKMGLEICRY